jgi:hypothetical protein
MRDRGKRSSMRKEGSIRGKGSARKGDNGNLRKSYYICIEVFNYLLVAVRSVEKMATVTGVTVSPAIVVQIVTNPASSRDVYMEFSNSTDTAIKKQT